MANIDMESVRAAVRIERHFDRARQSAVSLYDSDADDAITPATGDAIDDGDKTLDGDDESRIRRVDKVYNKKDHQWHLVPTVKEQKPDDVADKYALVVRRIIDAKTSLVSETVVDVASKKLADLLRDHFAGVNGLKLTKTPPEIAPKALYHAYDVLKQKQDELRKELGEKTRTESPYTQRFLEDVTATLGYLDDDFNGIKKSVTSLMEAGDMTYDLLWAIFPPKTIAYTEVNHFAQPQVMRVDETQYKETQCGKFFEVKGTILSHDGSQFGWGFVQWKIPMFDGSRRLLDLEVYPFERHEKLEGVRMMMVDRGRTFLELLKPVPREYEGPAIGAKKRSVLGDFVEEPFAGTGRVMIDPVAMRTQNPHLHMLMTPWTAKSATAASLSDEDVIFCNPCISGFSFQQKRWGSFAVRGTKEVEWNKDAFQKLILEDEKRKMITSLVKSHKSDQGGFDDIINGKGKGLIGLLTGSPGVGKTLTAEVVAELSERPLYVVTAGELGTAVDTVDKRLEMILDVVKRWGCVLLIDEADVFLHRRNALQLERNALVSIFLRRLEYFQGIAILTTNRRQDIDEAFKSRIHFRFNYPVLDEDGKYQIWKNFFDSMASQLQGLYLGDSDLRSLASYNLNGREIKNIISCIASIAEANEEPLTVKEVRKMIDRLIGLNDDDDDEYA